MTGPAKHGAIVYSADIKALAGFYSALFSMQIARETLELISLVKDGFNIVIHTPPFDMPKPHFSAVKLFITVDNLAAAKLKAQQLGGTVFEGEWSNPIFTVCNIADSDGNVIQLREFKA
jgi:predicted enzyme related to lactoylglutathione lyase